LQRSEHELTCHVNEALLDAVGEGRLTGSERFGISSALVTPFGSDGRVDVGRLVRHAADLLSRGCRSATLFGTTGEGPSVGAVERERVASALVAEGLPPERLVEGVIASSVEEAAECTGRALARGAKAVLLAPPFYFRDGPDEAVAAWFSGVFRRVGPGLRDILLYHIPSMTGVPVSLRTVATLRADFPGAILGVKDSACDEAATLRLIEAHGDLTILVGDETYLGRACSAGASGSICGLGNVVPEAVIAVAESGRDDPRVAALVGAIGRHPIIPMVKALVGHVRGDPAWARARPPLPTIGATALGSVIPYLEPFRVPAESAA
jgi:4-hydroxy-tetrahydrodipicolinate synthase